VSGSLKASLLWSNAGIPHLPTPHHLRSLSLYEAYAYECQQKVEDFLHNFDNQEDDIVGSESSPAPPQSNFNVREIFALKCRWGRVDQIVANNDDNYVISWLTSQVMLCLNVLISNDKIQELQLEATCRLGTQSLHAIASLIEQGNGITIACIRQKFLVIFFTAFKILLDVGTMERNACLCDVESACWALLAGLALKDEFTVNYLLVVHREWVTGTMIRYLHAHWFRYNNRHHRDQPQSLEDEIITSVESVNIMIMRLLKHCLAHGLGLRCCSDLLLAINVKYLQDNLSDLHSTYDSDHIPIDFFVLFEQAVRTASSWLLSDESDSINAVDSDLRSQQADAVEFSSSILSFASKHWTYFEHVIKQSIERNDTIIDNRNQIDERLLVAQASVLNFLCSLFISTCPPAKGSSNDQSLDSFLTTKEMSIPLSIESLIFRLNCDLVQKINKSLQLWGCGLISAVLLHAERVELTQDINDSSRSIDATLEHVRGQCIHMLTKSRSGQLMFPQSAFDYVDTMIKVMSKYREKIGKLDLNWRVVECILVWQRYLSVSTLTNIYDLYSSYYTNMITSGLSSFVTFIGTTKELIHQCSLLMNNYNCRSRSESTTNNTISNSGHLGSVSRGLIDWHLQRLLDSSILLMIIFKSNTLAMLHILNVIFERMSSDLIVSLTIELKTSISDSLYSLTSHTFSGPKTVLFLWYIQDLIFISLLKDQMHHHHGSIATKDYSKMKEQTDQLSVSIIDYVTNNNYFRNEDNSKVSIFSEDALKYFKCLSGSSLKLQDDSQSYGKPRVISLDHMWAFKVLIKLPRKEMQKWLVVLSHEVDACLLNDVHDMDAESRIDAIASAQFYLLQLCVTDQHEKWLSNLSESHQLVEIITDEEDSYGNYRNLMQDLSLQAMYYSRRLLRHSFADCFSRKAQDEFFSTTGMMLRSRVMNSGNKGRSTTREGVLDLSIKVIEASVNQIITYELHAIALLTLVSPMMPWVVRQRVWVEIGSLRLVHLMSYDEYLIPLLPIHLMTNITDNIICSIGDNVIIPNPCESISLYMDIVRALCRLRSPADRSLSVVAVAVFQISRFIFNSIRVESCQPTIIKGSARQLLLSIQQFINYDEFGQAQSLWLLHSIISVAEIVHYASSISNVNFDIGSSNLLKSILEHLKRVISISESEPVVELKLLDIHGLIINVSCNQIFLDTNNNTGASMLTLCDLVAM